jgi:predicted Zn-dependent peptidase
MNQVRAYLHPTGLKILNTYIPSSESCAISLMIRVGSIYENNHIRGGAHLIEHMMFQGNKQLTTQSILSETLDSMGAVYNAYTNYDVTSYHIKVQKSYAQKAIDILCQMVSESLFRPKNVESEKKVVVEELRRLRDDPSSYVQELFFGIVFQGSPYGLSIGGSEKSVMDTDSEKLKKFWRERYILPNMLVSVSGNMDIEKLKQSLQLSPLFTATSKQGVVDKYDKALPIQKEPRLKVQVRKNTKQVQVQLGFPTPGLNHQGRFALRLAKVILGGNMSSRIFNSLRDRYGLAYSPSAQLSLYETMGEFSICSGVDGSNIFSDNLDKSKGKADPLAVILQEFFKLRLEKVPEDELHKAKEYVKGNILLEMEDNQRIAEYYGRLFLLDRPVFTVERFIEEIEKVTVDDIYQICQTIITPERMNLALIGNIKENEARQYLNKMHSKWSNIIKGKKGGGSEEYYFPHLLAQGQYTSQPGMFTLNSF